MVLTEQFEALAISSAQDNGVPNIRMVKLRTNVWNLNRAPEVIFEGKSLIADMISDNIIDALTKPLTEEEKLVLNASLSKGVLDTGELYLKKYQEKLISPAQLLDILIDDSVADPLLVDVRKYEDYENGRIPGAIWVANVDELGSKESEQELRRLLNEHVASGGANEIVVYCYTGHSAGLVAGVLGAKGFNIKNLRFGFNIGWAGLQEAPAAIMGPVCSHSPDEPCDPENPCIKTSGIDSESDCG